MAVVHFTKNIQRHVECPPSQVAGATLREVFDQVFRDNPQARRYILDDQGAVRKHIAVFVNGEQIQDRATLSDRVPADAEVHVIQALSGG